MIYAYFCHGRSDLSDPYAAFDTDPKKDIQCIHTFLFILRALCMPYCYDLSRYFIRNGIACIRFCRFGSGNIFFYERKKPCNGGMLFLYWSIYYREDFRIIVSKVHETVKEI